MDKEFKRMMELAGLTEIQIKKPNRVIKLNLPFKSTDSPIKIPLGDLENHYKDLINDLIKLNPQINPKFFLSHDGLQEDVFHDLYEKYNDEASIPEFYKSYFSWLWANLTADYDEYENDAIDIRWDQYNHMRDEFTDNAMNGKWLKVQGMTD